MRVLDFPTNFSSDCLLMQIEGSVLWFTIGMYRKFGLGVILNLHARAGFPPQKENVIYMKNVLNHDYHVQAKNRTFKILYEVSDRFVFNA